MEWIRFKDEQREMAKEDFGREMEGKRPKGRPITYGNNRLGKILHRRKEGYGNKLRRYRKTE